MVLPTNLNLQSLQDNEEVISLMIQFLKNELSPTCSEKIKNLIATCKECRELFEEVKFFFDEEDTLVFELLNKENIEESRQKFQSISSAHPPYFLFDEAVSEKELIQREIDNICSSCGS